MRRTEASDAAEPLLEARGSPWKIEVNDDARVLKVHTFTQQVGREKQSDIIRRARLPHAGSERRKPPDDFGSRYRPARNPAARSGERRYMSIGTEMREQSVDRITILREHDNLPIAV